MEGDPNGTPESTADLSTVEIVSGPLVRFASVIVFDLEKVPAWCGRANGTGPGLKATAEGVPVPERLTESRPLIASVLMFSVAFNGPVSEGVNVTVTVHWPPG